MNTSTIKILRLIIITFLMIDTSWALSDVEKKMVSYIDQNKVTAEVLLEKTVNINSGTKNISGVKETGMVFKKEFDDLGFKTRWISMPSEIGRAGHLFAEYGEGNEGRVLLIGHLDTVFDKTSSVQRFRRDGNIAHGPGVSDMKGGNVSIIYALKALQHADLLKNMKITIALIGDEEDIGTPQEITRKDLIEAAKQSRYALAFESSGKDMKEIAVSRRGFGRWTLKVSANQAHSSKIFSKESGYGASFEVARILNEFQNKLRSFDHLTFNPGLLSAGTQIDYKSAESKAVVFGKMNIIAPTGLVVGDIRFISNKQLDEAKKEMKKIVSKNLPGTSATIEFEDLYPAMSATEGNRKLAKLVSSVSQDLGYGSVKEEHPLQRGAADVSFVADHVDCVDGMGVLGFDEHSPKEHLDLTSLPKAASRAALTMHRLFNHSGF